MLPNIATLFINIIILVEMLMLTSVEAMLKNKKSETIARVEAKPEENLKTFKFKAYCTLDDFNDPSFIYQYVYELKKTLEDRYSIEDETVKTIEKGILYEFQLTFGGDGYDANDKDVEKLMNSFHEDKTLDELLREYNAKKKTKEKYQNKTKEEKAKLRELNEYKVAKLGLIVYIAKEALKKFLEKYNAQEGNKTAEMDEEKKKLESDLEIAKEAWDVVHNEKQHKDAAKEALEKFLEKYNAQNGKNKAKMENEKKKLEEELENAEKALNEYYRELKDFLVED